MQAERFRQIRNLFDATLEREQESRNAFLHEACQGDEELLMEVGKLLAAHGEPTAWIDEAVLGDPLPRLEGRRIGPYEILRQLGEGGMGAVYLAARADGVYRKVVALKIVRPAAATAEVLRRFQREREILASLDHPNIARITDGGTTDDGLPYLVMDYIEGEPIDVYCDHHRLDLKARLKLFRDICSAVQYAHEHHIVHRDLKPTNILVAHDGVVKLLDFGIAKLGEPGPEGATMLTRSDMCLMTPEYASPEQVTAGPATPATDVYALGVVLYELLTGRRPYRMQSRIIHEVIRVICEEPPTRPSAAVSEKDNEAAKTSAEAVSRFRAAAPAELRRQLSGDLDCILLKALEKDALRRYRSAHDFSEDVRLHLEGLGVEARQGALARTAAQFMSRNGWLLIAAAALGLAVYDGLVPVGAAFLFALLASIATGAYAASRRIFGKGFVRQTVPGLVKGLTIGILALIAAVSILSRWRVPGDVFPFAVLASWNLFVFFRAFLWLRRGRRLGPLLHDLSDPSSSVQLEPSRDGGARRTWRLGPAAWILLPLILVFLVLGVIPDPSYDWAIRAFLFFLAFFMSLYLWMDSDPRSRGSALGRPSRLGPGLVIICLVLITLPNIGVGPIKTAPNWFLAASFYLVFLWALPPLLISGRNEIRERGLAWSGRLIPWTNVLSYSWGQDTGLIEVLCLRIKRGTRISREVRIPMLSANRTQVDSIFREQLSEWP